MHSKTTVNRGDVWATDMDPTRGSEMNKVRPCLVVSNDRANKSSPLVTVVALTTTAPTKPYPFMVEVPDTANMPSTSWVHCGHLRSVDKERLGRYYTSIDSATMRKVDQAIAVQLSLRLKGS